MSPILDPAADFEDDGGTPDWRRRHMPRPPLIVMRPTGLRRLRSWYRRSSPVRIYVAMVVGLGAFAVLMVVAMFAALILYDAIQRG